MVNATKQAAMARTRRDRRLDCKLSALDPECHVPTDSLAVAAAIFEFDPSNGVEFALARSQPLSAVSANPLDTGWRWWFAGAEGYSWRATMAPCPPERRISPRTTISFDLVGIELGRLWGQP
jgi:hypothetical protein